jgi:two-component system nitrate/nitrite response regulator NarP
MAVHQPILEAGIRLLIDEEDAFKVVGQAHRKDEVVRLARELVPAIILLRIPMPGLPDLEAVARLTTELSDVPLLLFDLPGKPAMLQALQIGAKGVLSTQATPQLLFKSIRHVHANRVWTGESARGNEALPGNSAHDRRSRVTSDEHPARVAGHRRS